MTDRISCPECGGAGHQLLGRLRLVCRFCGGLGYVGDDNEPAADRPLVRVPFWDRPAMAGFPGCRFCLGRGIVVHAEDPERPGGTWHEGPCPACSPGSDRNVS